MQIVPNFGHVLDARCAGPSTQRDTIAQPLAHGLPYFSTDTLELHIWTGTAWERFVRASELSALEARVQDLEDHTHSLGEPQ